MRNSAILFLIITTLVLVSVTVMSSLNVAFPWVFYLTCIGQVLLIITVYKVLTDKYSTEKTFDDWYEDRQNPDSEL